MFEIDCIGEAFPSSTTMAKLPHTLRSEKTNHFHYASDRDPKSNAGGLFPSPKASASRVDMTHCVLHM